MMPENELRSRSQATSMVDALSRFGERKNHKALFVNIGEVYLGPLVTSLGRTRSDSSSQVRTLYRIA